MSKPTQTPSTEEIEEFVLSCRYGELEEVHQFAEQYGWDAVVAAKDDRGNTGLHMCCANGHVEIVNFLLPHLPSSYLQQTNNNGSPALHWAILNNQINCVKALVEHPEAQGGGLPLLKQKGRGGKDAFMFAISGGEGKEEVAGWIEGFLYKAEGDGEEEQEEGNVDAAEEEGAEVKVVAGDQVVEEEGKVVDELVEKTEDIKLSS